MAVPNYQMFTLGAKADPAPRIFKRSRSHSRETTRARKCDSVIGRFPDAPSRRLPMALPVALVIALGVCFVISQIQFVHKIELGAQYVATILAKTDALVDLKLEHGGCVSSGSRATSPDPCSAHDRNRAASHVLKRSSPDRGGSVFARRRADCSISKKT
jgi:hypothetical protein